jgi:RHS repeat-associated protein
VQCGYFYLTQQISGSSWSGPSPAAGLPPSGSSQDLSKNGAGDCSGGAPGPEPTAPAWIDTFHHRDHLGSLRIVTDAGGWVVGDGHDYYPFGMEMVPTNTFTGGGSRKRFTGHERDEASGLDYMLARYMTRTGQRFLAVDPAIESARTGIPQSWNRVVYAIGNPLLFTDPDGREIRFYDDADIEFKTRVLDAISAARTADKTGRVEAAYQALERSSNVHVIYPDSSEWVVATGSEANAKNGVGTGSRAAFPVADYEDADGRVNSAPELAAHMLSHMEDRDLGTHVSDPACEGCPAVAEVKAVQMQNLVAKDDPKRIYENKPVPDPTAVPPPTKRRESHQPSLGNEKK